MTMVTALVGGPLAGRTVGSDGETKWLIFPVRERRPGTIRLARYQVFLRTEEENIASFAGFEDA